METMRDKNGKEMITGQAVKIENAYFKNDNGFYFITNSPGDATWCGSDYGLIKIAKSGKISTASGNVGFWPLTAFVNSREKRIACREHNKQFATIEIIEGVPTENIVEYFNYKSELEKGSLKRSIWDFGEDSNVVKTSKAIIEHYEKVVERIK